MATLSLGIDVSKDHLDVAVLGAERPHYGRFPNTPDGYDRLLDWLRGLGGATVHACLEATGHYGEPLAQYLYDHDLPVSVVNPARIRAYAQSTLRRFKTDRGDAELIALYGQKECPSRWTPPPENVRELQALMRHREDLLSMRQQERNRLQSGVSSVRVRGDLEKHLAFLDEQIRQLDKDIAAHIDGDSDLRRQRELLLSIPGIGPTTAAVLLGEVRDLTGFDSARQLAAYAGLVPQPWESGTSVRRKPRLSKTGNARLRKALYLPAVVARTRNPLMRQLSERMAQTGHCPMAIIGAIMRKLLHLAYGVLKTGKPFDHACTVSA